MTSYTRQDTLDNIADGKVINAADLDAEFDQLEAAFNATTGHTHDGTAGEGAPITKVGPAQELSVTGTAVNPKTDDTYDLGSVASEWKDLYIDGTANIDNLVADAGTVGGSNIVSEAGVQTLTNKTITFADNTLTGVVGETATQTLTNKTHSTGSLWNGTAITAAYGGTGVSSLTANNVILGNGTSPVNFVAPGASGNVLTSNGTTWTSAAGSSSSLLGETDSATPFNTSLGYQAGNALTTGDENVLIGYQAGDALTTGSENVVIGKGALGLADTVSNTVAIGRDAGGESLSRSSVFIGTNAGARQKAIQSISVCIGNSAGVGAVAGATGIYNIAIGGSAMGAVSSGSSNVAIGYQSLEDVTTSSNNTSVGNQAGKQVTSGANNTFLGALAGATGTNDLTTGGNNTIIGYNAAASSATVTGEITLGNSSITTLRCQVTTITSLSDRRDKSGIHDLDAGLDFINKLKPVRFTWDMRDGGKVGEEDTGFIAQDLKAAQEESGKNIPGLVYEVSEDRMEAGYGKLLPVLVKAIQELSEEVELLKAQLENKNG